MSEQKKSRNNFVAPSILSADFGRLAEEIAAVEEAGADMIHLDVMDGHFVPNITFGPDLVESIRKITKLPLDVHLMISKPELYIPRFVEAGADYLTVHIEAGPHVHRNVQTIKSLGLKAGISLNPHSPLVSVTEMMSELDLLLLMSVNPGFGGQKFIEKTLEKIRVARRLIDGAGYSCLIEIDGGINAKTGKQCIEAGVDILVAGNYIFRSNDYKAAIGSLRE
jgi:ribulose-phosphate 3-epimerase